ncbi:MAG: HD domain-containing protein [Gloeocapsa sp. DLM2.Bin57]|nr:MAG: HD domain-containing protein [Gloeocapsa sp. DLM2.Bin57]
MLKQISKILLTRGKQQYDGEAVSQLEHALQCAYLAQQAKNSPSAIASCLLHDLGHLLPGVIPHQENALSLLTPIFKPKVTEPIKLHVEAKRYLCSVDPQYYSTLSLASQHSLARQGGKFSQAESANFLAQPYATAAIQLRRWDDQAKVAGLVTPDLA